MKKYLVEFIGTFFLVISIVLAVGGNAGNLAPIAIGTVLIAVIYAGGHISGAHYNPAVTMAFWMRGKFPASDIPGYIIAQFAGSIAAAILGAHLLTHMESAVGIQMAGQFDFLVGVIAEFLGTFALVYVILHVATAKGTEGNDYYGLAIGFTVIGCIYIFGGISGAVLNPAVAVGISICEMTTWANLPAFFVGQLAAGIVATITFKYVNGPD